MTSPAEQTVIAAWSYTWLERKQTWLRQIQTRVKFRLRGRYHMSQSTWVVRAWLRPANHPLLRSACGRQTSQQRSKVQTASEVLVSGRKTWDGTLVMKSRPKTMMESKKYFESLLASSWSSEARIPLGMSHRHLPDGHPWTAGQHRETISCLEVKVEAVAEEKAMAASVSGMATRGEVGWASRFQLLPFAVRTV